MTFCILYVYIYQSKNNNAYKERGAENYKKIT
jgi:hypothetical protein